MSNSTESQVSAVAEVVEARRDLIKALLLCLLGVIVVRSFLFEPFKIPSSSMVPTLHIGDHIFVSKFPYGLTIPFSKLELVSWSAPKRGEIIVFLFPRDESLHYIKRVVGVPGDRVEFKGRDLYINGDLVPKTEVTDEKEIEAVTGQKNFGGALFKETIGGITHYIKHASSTNYDFQRLNHSEYIVEPDKYFVVGDNRDDSYDSRSWRSVPKENIKGRAEVIWLSLDSSKEWGADKVRWKRIGSIVE